MEIKLKRIARKADYTIGHLFVDGQYVCDAIEDTDRGLNQQMPLTEIQRIKIKDRTAIPAGQYRVTLDVKSPKYSNFARYPWARAIDGRVPRILNVTGFEGILIHVGNTAADTSGCVIVGENKVAGKVINSTAAFNKLYSMMANAKGGIFITIE